MKTWKAVEIKGFRVTRNVSSFQELKKAGQSY